MTHRPDTVQPSLFDPPPAPRRRRRTGIAATARDAGHAHRPRAAAQRARILDALRAAGPSGLTRHEVQERLPDIPLQSVCSGVDALLQRHLVGEQLAGPGERGTFARRDGRKIVVVREYLDDVPLCETASA